MSPDVLYGTVSTGEVQRRKYALLMAKLAKELVNIGYSHISTSSGQNTGSLFGFKAGVHAGPLGAGILGRTRRFYKIFGDTVVMSARLSQSAKANSVLISSKVLQFSPRGLLPRLLPVALTLKASHRVCSCFR